MSKHIEEEHGARNGEVLADAWLQRSNKQAWSCGFCVFYFPSLKERLNHVCVNHFEKGQRLDAWRSTNVIQGLLLQPSLHEAWQQLLLGLDPLFRKDLVWKPGQSKDLQGSLEIGPTSNCPADTLAKAAYRTSQYSWESSDIDDVGFAFTIPSLDMDPNSEQAVDAPELAIQHPSQSACYSAIPTGSHCIPKSRSVGPSSLLPVSASQTSQASFQGDHSVSELLWDTLGGNTTLSYPFPGDLSQYEQFEASTAQTLCKPSIIEDAATEDAATSNSEPSYAFDYSD